MRGLIGAPVCPKNLCFQRCGCQLEIVPELSDSLPSLTLHVLLDGQARVEKYVAALLGGKCVGLFLGELKAGQSLGTHIVSQVIRTLSCPSSVP